MSAPADSLPRYETKDVPKDLPLGTRYVEIAGCSECKGDLEVGAGVYIRCTVCDHKLLSG